MKYLKHSAFKMNVTLLQAFISLAGVCDNKGVSKVRDPHG